MEGATGRKEAGAAHHLLQKGAPLCLGAFLLERSQGHKLEAKKANVRILLWLLHIGNGERKSRRYMGV